MRAFVLALAIAGAAVAASAQDNSDGVPSGAIRVEKAPPPVPGGARKQAEGVIRAGRTDPDSTLFRAERVIEAELVGHGFGPRIEGPVSIVCGQYNARDRSGAYGGYAWYFVAIKHGQVLWADVDETGAPGPGYYGCKGAGLAS